MFGLLDLTAPQFLKLFAGLIAGSTALSWFLARFLRPTGRPSSIDDPDEVAFLSGGTVRMAEAAAVRLLASKSLKRVGAFGLDAVRPGEGNTRIERAILAYARPANWPQILGHLRAYAEPVERGLVHKNLLIDPAQFHWYRLFQAMPIMLVILVGIVRAWVGYGLGRPIGYLTAMLVVAGLLLARRWFGLDRKTAEGRALVVRLREQADSMRRAPREQDIGTAVALFGTSVLAASSLADFNRIQKGPADSGGGCGGSSDSGGGGCGGGGCGGGGCGG